MGISNERKAANGTERQTEEIVATLRHTHRHTHRQIQEIDSEWCARAILQHLRLEAESDKSHKHASLTNMQQCAR